MVSLDVSSNDFLQKPDFDHFDLILFKRLFCEISFSDFVYLLLDLVTSLKQNKKSYLELSFTRISDKQHIVNYFKSIAASHENESSAECFNGCFVFRGSLRFSKHSAYA